MKKLLPPGRGGIGLSELGKRQGSDRTLERSKGGKSSPLRLQRWTEWYSEIPSR